MQADNKHWEDQYPLCMVPKDFGVLDQPDHLRAVKRSLAKVHNAADSR